jgi:hypothetical protein
MRLQIMYTIKFPNITTESVIYDFLVILKKFDLGTKNSLE